MATVLCRADKLVGLPTLRQANCTPTQKLPVGGYVAIVSLPHQNMRWEVGWGKMWGDEDRKWNFTQAVLPQPILDELLSCFLCTSWGQTRRALEPILSPIRPSPHGPDHCGKATGRYGLFPTVRVAGPTRTRGKAETAAHLAKLRACHSARRELWNLPN